MLFTYVTSAGCSRPGTSVPTTVYTAILTVTSRVCGRLAALELGDVVRVPVVHSFSSLPPSSFLSTKQKYQLPSFFFYYNYYSCAQNSSCFPTARVIVDGLKVPFRQAGVGKRRRLSMFRLICPSNLTQVIRRGAVVVTCCKMMLKMGVSEAVVACSPGEAGATIFRRILTPALTATPQAHSLARVYRLRMRAGQLKVLAQAFLW